MKMSDLVRDLISQGKTPDDILAAVIDAEASETPDELVTAVRYYNEAAERSGWSKCMGLNPSRRSKLKARIKDAGGLAGWHNAMERAEQSPFLTGDSREGWLPGFDFFLQQSSFQKLVEGYYDRKQSRAPRDATVDAFSQAIGGLASRRQGQRDIQPAAPSPPAYLPRKSLFG